MFSGSEDGSVRLWDVRLLRPIHALFGHTGAISTLLFSKSDVISSSADGSIRVWDRNTGSCRRTFVGHSGAVTCVQPLKTTDMIVSGGQDGTVRVWRSRGERGEVVRVLRGHVNGVRCVEVMDHNIIVSGGRDGCLRVWDSSRWKCLRSLKAHGRSVECVSVNPNVYYPQMVSTGLDGRMRLWQFHKMLTISKRKK